MADRNGVSHINPPLLGSGRSSKRYGEFFSDVPIEALNSSYYNFWSLSPMLDVVEPVSGTDTSVNGLQWGTGSGSAEPTTPALNSSGGVFGQTGATIGNEGLYVGPQLFQPVADKPITYFFQGRITDVSAMHMFVGLAAISNVDAGGPLLVGGAIGAVDVVGFHMNVTSTQVPALTVKDGAGTADVLSTGITLLDATDFVAALEVRSTSVRYFFQQDGGEPFEGRLTPSNTTLTSLAQMGPCFVAQADAAAAQTFTWWRCWVAQQKRYSGNFIAWN